MNKIVKFFIYLLIGILQLTLMPLLQIKGMVPNLILIGSVVLALACFEEDSLYLAGVGGLVLDWAGPLFFGFYTLTFIGFVLIIKYLLHKASPEINFILMFFMTFFLVIIFGLIANLFFNRMPSLNLLIDAVYSAVLGVIFFLFLQKLVVRNQVITL